jgi:hypothetical protein
MFAKSHESWDYLFVIATTTRQGDPKTLLTQKRAAELLGVTRWYLNRVIRGHVTSKRLSKRLDQLRSEFPSPQTNI